MGTNKERIQTAVDSSFKYEEKTSEYTIYVLTDKPTLEHTFKHFVYKVM